MAEPVAWSWYVNGSRRLPALKTLGTEGDPKRDDYLEKLVKLFPVEIVTFFTGADQFARAATGGLKLVLLFVVAVAGLIFVPIAFAKLRKVNWKTRPGLIQVLIGIAGYVIWVYAQGVLSAEVGIYEASVAGVAAFLFLTVVLLYGPKPEEPKPSSS